MGRYRKLCGIVATSLQVIDDAVATHTIDRRRKTSRAATMPSSYTLNQDGAAAKGCDTGIERQLAARSNDRLLRYPYGALDSS